MELPGLSVGRGQGPRTAQPLSWGVEGKERDSGCCGPRVSPSLSHIPLPRLLSPHPSSLPSVMGLSGETLSFFTCKPWPVACQPWEQAGLVALATVETSLGVLEAAPCAGSHLCPQVWTLTRQGGGCLLTALQTRGPGLGPGVSRWLPPAQCALLRPAVEITGYDVGAPGPQPCPAPHWWVTALSASAPPSIKRAVGLDDFWHRPKPPSRGESAGPQVHFQLLSNLDSGVTGIW